MLAPMTFRATRLENRLNFALEIDLGCGPRRDDEKARPDPNQRDNGV
jgi:hypothetical protein